MYQEIIKMHQETLQWLSAYPIALFLYNVLEKALTFSYCFILWYQIVELLLSFKSDDAPELPIPQQIQRILVTLCMLTVLIMLTETKILWVIAVFALFTIVLIVCVLGAVIFDFFTIRK